MIGKQHRWMIGAALALLVASAAALLWRQYDTQREVDAVMALLAPLLQVDPIPAEDNYRQRLTRFQSQRETLDNLRQQITHDRARQLADAAQPFVDALHQQLSETADWLDQLARLSQMRGSQLLASGDIAAVAQQLRRAALFYNRYGANLLPRNNTLLASLNDSDLAEQDRIRLAELWRAQQPPGADPSEPRSERLRKLALMLDASANLFEFVAVHQQQLAPVDKQLTEAQQQAAAETRRALAKELLALSGALNQALLEWTRITTSPPPPAPYR